MRLSDIRKHIRQEYLGSNTIISGAEAKDLVKTVAGDAMTPAKKAQLEKMRAEFSDAFSAAGLREFDKALAQAASSTTPGSDGTVPPGTGSPLDVRLGRFLPQAQSVVLASVSDKKVRAALAKLDFNTDGKVDAKDRDKMGFSDDQWQSFLFMAALMGQNISHDVVVPLDLTGKRVSFTAVPDKAKAKEWAEAMGASVTDTLDGRLDFLFVGLAETTGKDERAAAMNALGEANITLANYTLFSRRAAEAGVVGGPTDNLTPAELSAKIATDVNAWYTEHIQSHYAEAIAETTDPAERARLAANRTTDLDAGIEHWQVPLADASWFESVSDGDYTDRLGRPLNRNDLVEVQASFFPEYAGIGLGTYFLVEKITGDVIDQGDIVD